MKNTRNKTHLENKISITQEFTMETEFVDIDNSLIEDKLSNKPHKNKKNKGEKPPRKNFSHYEIVVALLLGFALYNSPDTVCDAFSKVIKALLILL